MGDALDITVRRERGAVIAAVTGDVDISTLTRLRECLFELADSGRQGAAVSLGGEPTVRISSELGPPPRGAR